MTSPLTYAAWSLDDGGERRACWEGGQFGCLVTWNSVFLTCRFPVVNKMIIMIITPTPSLLPVLVFFSLTVICEFSVVFQPVVVICLPWWHAAPSKNEEKTPFRHYQLERQLDWTKPLQGYWAVIWMCRLLSLGCVWVAVFFQINLHSPLAHIFLRFTCRYAGYVCVYRLSITIGFPVFEYIEVRIRSKELFQATLWGAQQWKARELLVTNEEPLAGQPLLCYANSSPLYAETDPFLPFLNKIDIILSFYCQLSCLRMAVIWQCLMARVCLWCVWRKVAGRVCVWIPELRVKRDRFLWGWI